MKKILLLSLSLVSLQSFAGDCKSPIDLSKFLDDPQTFLNAPIVKLDSNCLPKLITRSFRPHATPSFSEELVKSGDFVEIKDSIRQKICLNVDDKEVCLGEIESGSDIPTGRAPILSLDEPSNLVTGKVIRTLEEIKELGLTEGKIDIDPWSDWYWPIAVGQLGHRYASPGLTKIWTNDVPEDDTWKVLKNYVEKNPYYNQEINELSPSEKYDILVGDKNFTLTQAMWATGRGYYEQYGKVEFWMGICHGWAPAAYMLPRPKKSINVTAADGETEIKFYPSDLKALGSLLYATGYTRTKFVGARCNVKKPKTDRNGRIQDQNCFDNNPGSWHMTVVSQIGRNQKPFVIDATYDIEVWNHPVVAYSYTYFNPNTMKEYDSYEKAVVAIEDFEKDKFANYRSQDAASVVGVRMEVKYLVETMPTTDETDNVKKDDFNYAYYTYDLELNAEGEIIGGEWYTNKHPDFMWTPYYSEHAVSVLDEYIEGYISEDIVLNPQFQKYVPEASAQGQPVSKLIHALFKKASK